MRCIARKSGLRCHKREHGLGWHVAIDNDGTIVWWPRITIDLARLPKGD